MKPAELEEFRIEAGRSRPWAVKAKDNTPWIENRQDRRTLPESDLELASELPLQDKSLLIKRGPIAGLKVIWNSWLPISDRLIVVGMAFLTWFYLLPHWRPRRTSGSTGSPRST